MGSRTPAIFVGHGAPTIALDADKGAPLARLAGSFDRPDAILVVSAHWTAPRATLGAVETLPLIYDFQGFPEALSRVRWPAPGAPELAGRVRELLGGDADEASGRGLDHGVWTPLVWMYPNADVPVLQLAMPAGASYAELYALGQRLAPLRDERVLIVGSGNLTHNLRRVDFSEREPPPAWAADFDAWAADVLTRWDVEALLDAPARAPEFRTNHPTDEHLRPLLVVAGAAGHGRPEVSFPVTGFEFGSLSRRAVRLDG
ncbi:MAG: dioxygenase [Deltaproteobacteria bacterium]|nr:dioxygenase [Deltaproteobacteria bacterium]MCB9787183.1 dioxygenase [Deltaproteobacteria bacterium]